MKNLFLFSIKLLFGVPIIIAMSFVWSIVFLIDQNRFGNILVKTGIKFKNTENE